MLKRISLVTIIIVSTISLSNCDRENIILFDNTFILSPQVIENISVFTKGNVYMNVVDTFLIIQKAEEMYIQIYSTNSHNLLAELGRKGYGPNEMISPNLIKQEHMNSNSVFIFDFAKQVIIPVNVDSAINNNNGNYEERLIDELLVYLFFKDEDILVGALPNGQTIIYNFDNNQTYITSYKPDMKINVHENSLPSIYRPAAVVNKTKKLIAVAPLLLGALNFYDLEGNWLKSTVFDDLYNYKNELIAGESSFKDIKYQIARLEADENYIYALNFNNSVTNYYEKFREENPKIQVFDWEGNPLVEYHLDDRTITAFTIDEIHHRIYAYSHQEGNILYYDYSIENNHMQLSVN